MEVRELLDLALETVEGNQAELARRLGRSETTVSRWVAGRNGIDYESALRLARLTRLPADQVVAACGLDATLVPATDPSISHPDIIDLRQVRNSRIKEAIRLLAEAGARGLIDAYLPAYAGAS